MRLRGLWHALPLRNCVRYLVTPCEEWNRDLEPEPRSFKVLWELQLPAPESISFSRLCRQGSSDAHGASFLSSVSKHFRGFQRLFLTMTKAFRIYFCHAESFRMQSSVVWCGCTLLKFTKTQNNPTPFRNLDPKLANTTTLGFCWEVFMSRWLFAAPRLNLTAASALTPKTLRGM